jgi:hypothetical protein
MARGHNLRGSYPLTSVTGDSFIYCVSFETNNTDDPDGVVQDNDGVTIAREDTGDYSITFPANAKPAALLFGCAEFREDLPGWHAKVTSYTDSTGVLLVTAYDEDDTSGIEAAADSTDKTLSVFCVFARKAANS